MTEKKETEEPNITTKQARITEIAREIFTGRCAQNNELKGYLELFISNEKKNIIRDKESKERELRRLAYEKSKREYEEFIRAEENMAADEDFIFKPLEDDFAEIIKKEYYGAQPKSGRVGYYPEKTYSQAEREKALERMIEKIRQSQIGYDPYTSFPLPKTRRNSAPVAPVPYPEGPTYDDNVKARLDELDEAMNKEIEMAFHLAKLFVDRRLRVLK